MAPLVSKQPAAWLQREDVPVVINSYNRLGCLRELIAWLVRAGQRQLYVVDNASKYPPLLTYLDWLHASKVATVVRLSENAGHLAVWRHCILDRLGIDSEFVYTDPDVVPADSCPSDVIGTLQSVLADNEQIAVAGLGLRLDDLPDSYRHKAQAIDWERQFWLAPAAPGLFLAPIDTTFALYRPGSGHCLGHPSIRTGWPYVAAHRGWYADEARLSDEDLFYRRTAARGTSNWSIPAVPEWLTMAARERAGQQPCLIQVTRPGVVLPGYVAAGGDGDIALPSASVDGVYVADEPSHLTENPRLRSELRRVVKADGRLVVHTGPLERTAMCAILRQEPGWMAGWRLRRAVVAMKGAQVAMADAGLGHPIDALMLHLDPALEASPEVQPDIEFGSLDYWPGFAAA